MRGPCASRSSPSRPRSRRRRGASGVRAAASSRPRPRRRSRCRAGSEDRARCPGTKPASTPPQAAATTRRFPRQKRGCGCVGERDVLGVRHDQDDQSGPSGTKGRRAASGEEAVDRRPQVDVAELGELEQAVVADGRVERRDVHDRLGQRSPRRSGARCGASTRIRPARSSRRARSGRPGWMSSRSHSSRSSRRRRLLELLAALDACRRAAASSRGRACGDAPAAPASLGGGPPRRAGAEARALQSLPADRRRACHPEPVDPNPPSSRSLAGSSVTAPARARQPDEHELGDAIPTPNRTGSRRSVLWAITSTSPR